MSHIHYYVCFVPIPAITFCSICFTVFLAVTLSFMKRLNLFSNLFASISVLDMALEALSFSVWSLAICLSQTDSCFFASVRRWLYGKAKRVCMSALQRVRRYRHESKTYLAASYSLLLVLSCSSNAATSSLSLSSPCLDEDNWKDAERMQWAQTMPLMQSNKAMQTHLIFHRDVLSLQLFNL